MAKVKKINHIAVVVEDIQSSLAFWEGALGIKLEKVEDIPAQKAKVAFLPVGEGEVELVQPTDPESGTGKFLKERGGGMHHLCLEVDDIAGMLAQMKEKGVRLINEAPLEMEGRKIAFIHPKSASGVLVELYELTR
ncbi:MAG: methylmalonyl-CoA epimerase [Pelolinea sp.]|nr:methylmalonyl-CoA epimerase [Pelolinea sp.]